MCRLRRYTTRARSWIGTVAALCALAAVAVTVAVWRSGEVRRAAYEGLPPSAPRVIVRFHDLNRARVVSSMLADGNGLPSTVSRRRAMLTLPVPGGTSVPAFAAGVARLPGVAYCVPDYIATTAEDRALPVDPDLGDDAPTGPYTPHWWLEAAGVPTAWRLGLQGHTPLRAPSSAVPVAIVDTGFYLDHPDMAGMAGGRDEFHEWSEASGPVADGTLEPAANRDLRFAAHGTAVAVVAGGSANGNGTAGVAFDATMRGYKVAGILGGGQVAALDSAIVRAIIDATDDGCRVINISLCQAAPSPALQDAVDYATSRGVLVVAAAGNSAGAVEFPAACRGVIAVGATGLRTGSLAPMSFSARGPQIALVAPGDYVWSATAPNENLNGSETATGYAYWSGTSLAAPAVAGAASWLWRAAPFLEAEGVSSYLERSARALGKNESESAGRGELDVGAAYEALARDFAYVRVTGAIPATVPRRAVRITWKSEAPEDAGYAVTLDGSAAGSPPASNACTLTGLANGVHSLRVAPSSGERWTDGESAWVASFTVGPVLGRPGVPSAARLGRAIVITGAAQSPASPGSQPRVNIRLARRVGRRWVPGGVVRASLSAYRVSPDGCAALRYSASWRPSTRGTWRIFADLGGSTGPVATLAVR